MLRIGLVGGLLVASAAVGDEWTLATTAEGMQVETRPAPGSDFEQIRVTRSLPLAPEKTCAAIWTRDISNEPWLPKGKLLREAGDERWYYERVAAPLVNDRDYTLHVWREGASDGGCVVRFDLDNSQGPPPGPGVVRMTALEGSWVVTAAGERGSKVVYTLFNDPGGNIPALLSRSTQRARAVEWLKMTFAQATRARGAGGP